MNLIDAAKRFSSEEAALDYLENLRWPKGVRCLVCGGDRISKYQSRTNRKDRKTGEVKQGPLRFLYECLEPTCKHQFTATTGTIFHDTHLPLEKWLLAVALMTNAKKGLSAKQVQRDLDISYQTAWYLCHRIREAMQAEDGLFGGQVEMDETFVGGRYDARRKRASYDKQAVMGVMQRANESGHSKVRVMPIPNRGREVIAQVVKDYVSFDAEIFTDEWSGYRHLKQTHDHSIVIHTKGEYVRGEVHTNSVEGFWSLVKRQIIGQHHFVSVKHLQRYLNEMSFRFNNREADLFTLVVVRLLIGKALQYKRLIAKSDVPTSASEPDEPF